MTCFLPELKTSNLVNGATIETEFMNGERISLSQTSTDIQIEI